MEEPEMNRLILSMGAVLLFTAPAFAAPISNTDIRRRIASGHYRSLRADHWDKGEGRDEEMELLFEMQRYAASAAMFKEVADTGASGTALMLAFARLEEDAAEIDKKVAVARARQRDWPLLSDVIRQMDRVKQVNAQARPVFAAVVKAVKAPVRPNTPRPPLVRLGETGEIEDKTITLDTHSEWPIRALRFTNKGGKSQYIRIVSVKITTADKKEVNQTMYAKVARRAAIEIPLPGAYDIRKLEFRIKHESDGLVVEGVTAK
jgi:hypothetical protein